MSYHWHDDEYGWCSCDEPAEPNPSAATMQGVERIVTQPPAAEFSPPLVDEPTEPKDAR